MIKKYLNILVFIINPLILYGLYQFIAQNVPTIYRFIFFINICLWLVRLGNEDWKEGEYKKMIKSIGKGVYKLVFSQKLVILIVFLLPSYFMPIWAAISNFILVIITGNGVIWKSNGAMKIDPLFMKAGGEKIIKEGKGVIGFFSDIARGLTFIRYQNRPMRGITYPFPSEFYDPTTMEAVKKVNEKVGAAYLHRAYQNFPFKFKKSIGTILNWSHKKMGKKIPIFEWMEMVGRAESRFLTGNGETPTPVYGNEGQILSVILGDAGHNQRVSGADGLSGILLSEYLNMGPIQPTAVVNGHAVEFRIGDVYYEVKPGQTYMKNPLRNSALEAVIQLNKERINTALGDKIALVLDFSGEDIDTYKRVKEEISKIGYEFSIICVHSGDSKIMKELTFRAAGIIGAHDQFYEGIEERLSETQRSALEKLQRGLDKEVQEAYKRLCEIQKNNLVEHEPKWNNGYDGEDENGEPILDQDGETMRNMFGG